MAIQHHNSKFDSDGSVTKTQDLQPADTAVLHIMATITVSANYRNVLRKKKNPNAHITGFGAP
jgi:hypothetical protein